MHVFLSGAGQLGSRYLQGITKCPGITKITVVDPSQESLNRALERYKETNGDSSLVNTYLTLPNEIGDVDLAIITTLSTVRKDVVSQLNYRTNIKNWILEKVLAPSVKEIDSIERDLRVRSRAWVNTPRRTMPWYSKIKEHINKSNHNNSPLSIEIMGSHWGLACNTIHFLDLAEWITDSYIQVCETRAQLHWQEAKRKGFLEAYGTLECAMEGGNTLKVSCTSEDNSPLTISIKSKNNQITINEQEGYAFDKATSTLLPGKILFQSELTTSLVDEILADGKSALPTLATSAKQHRLFLKCLSRDLEDSSYPGNPESSLPIT